MIPANTTTFDRSLVLDALDAVQLDGSDAIRDDYSGRGMFGATCFGVVVSSTTQAFEFFAALGRAVGETGDNPEVAEDLARTARTDSIGMDTIVYFPGCDLD